MAKANDKWTSGSANSLAFYNMLGPIILNGVNFFTVPIFTRVLGPANFGVVSLYTTWVQLFTILIGLQTSGTIAPSMVHYDEDEEKRYLSSILSLSLLSFGVLTLLAILFIKPLSAFTGFPVQIIVMMLLQSFGAYMIGFGNIFFTYEKKAKLNFVLSVSVTILTIGLSLLLVLLVDKPETNYNGRITGMMLPNLALGVVLLVYFFRRGGSFYDKEYWKFCLPLSLPLIFHGLSQIILAHNAKVMLQQYTGDRVLVGVFSLVLTLTNILNVIYNALNNTWVPFFYDYMKTDDHEAIRRRGQNYLLLFAIICSGFMLLAPEMILLFAGEEYRDGISLVPVLTLAAFFTFLYSFPVNYQFFHRKTTNIAIGTAMAAGMNVVLNVLLIKPLGMMGAALATTAAYLLLFLFHEWIARHKIKGTYPMPFRLYIPVLALVLAAAALSYLLLALAWPRWLFAIALAAWLLGRTLRNRTIF